MIYITGDTHIPIDIRKLNSNNFDTDGMTKEDYVIICGDFGAIWNYTGENYEEKYWLKWLDDKPFTTLFVDGNHECFPRLNKYPVEVWNGGKIHRIRPSVIHLMRGQVFTIDEMKFFTMGGASSHDKEYRKEGETWWKEELPSQEEYDEALKNLDAHNWEVDYVVTHCMSDNIQHKLAYWYEHDKLTNFLFTVDKSLKFKHWYSGHYHISEQVDDKHTVLYDNIVRIS
jgi:hypothetical protein